LTEAAAALGDTGVARQAYELLMRFAYLPVMPSLAVVCFGSVERPLGLAALTLGDVEAAVRHSSWTKTEGRGSGVAYARYKNIGAYCAVVAEVEATGAELRVTRLVAVVDVGLPVTTGGEVGYLTEVFNNMVTKLRESRTELERLSVTDPLTGLYNRLRMMEVLDNEVRRSRRLRHPFAVLMADLDLFKKYNDAHGHQAGDAVLKRIGAIMREASRDVDFVARYGGEEFLLMMPETEIDAATKLAERIRRKIADEKLPAGKITLSLGVAAFPLHGDGPDLLIAAADAALYEAKRAGGNRVVHATGPVVPATRNS